MTGYSGTPLVKKLDIKEGHQILLVNAPNGFLELISPLPNNIKFVSQITSNTDMVHIFSTKRNMLQASLLNFRKIIRANGIIWVSWPKKSAKVPTDITEDVIRELALPLGFVDIKVCAVDDIWSALKLVLRKENRE